MGGIRGTFCACVCKIVPRAHRKVGFSCNSATCRNWTRSWGSRNTGREQMGKAWSNAEAERDVAMFWVKWLSADPNTPTQLWPLQSPQKPHPDPCPQLLTPIHWSPVLPTCPPHHVPISLAYRHSNPQMAPGNNLFPRYGRRKTLSSLICSFHIQGKDFFLTSYAP